MKSTENSEQQFDNIIEEYLTRLDQGENPDPEKYAQRYPEHADELLEFINNMHILDKQIEEENDAKQTLNTTLLTDQTQETSINELITQQTLPTITGYTILAEIGGGSQGTVYKAIQEGTNRIVAIKIIREGALATSTDRLRFDNEVKLVSRLKHPNVVVVYSFGHEHHHAYFAMEYVAGDPLDIFMSTHTLDISTTLHLFHQLCEAINHSHINGVIHRDIKPSNIIVDENNHLKVVDFGLAKRIIDGDDDVHSNITMVGQFAGTWQYASPEQVMRKSDLIDVRSDIYALGVILYEMLTDLLPYPISNESRGSIENHIINTIPPSVSSIRSEVDRDLDTIILKTLHKEPERRYQSVVSLLEDLTRYTHGHAIEARRDSAWYMFYKTLTRYKWQVAAVGISFMTLLLFSVTISLLYSKANSARATTELRSRIVHDSQRYTSDKLDELTIVSNRLNEIIDAHPDLPEIQKYQKDEYFKPLEFFEPIVKDMPANIYEVIMNQEQPAYGIADQWLKDHSDELDHVVRIAKTSRFVFGIDQSTTVNLELYDRPINLGAVRKVCHALLARAIYLYISGNHKRVIDQLDTVRSIVVNINDSRMWVQKNISLAIGSALYDAIIYIFNDAIVNSQSIGVYLDWTLQDPPIAEYRLSLYTERVQLSQIFEVSSVSHDLAGNGYIDLYQLNQITDGCYHDLGMMTEEMYALSKQLTHYAIMQDLDMYFKEIEHWDPLNFFQLEDRNKILFIRLNQSDSFQLVRPLLSTLKDAFQYRARVCSKRNSTLIAAYLIQYRIANLSWPTEVCKALPLAEKHLIDDPFTGTVYGYKIVDNKPLLYSFNEDGVDNDGHHGDWGDPGTDIVLFNPHR